MSNIKGGMKILIIIPAYNEAQKIYSVVENVVFRGYSAKGGPWDLVVVDDGSSDGTSDQARRAGAIVLRHFINRGYGAALTTGNSWALRNGYDIAVHFDGDGQHDADEIRRVIGPILDNQADVVIGSRFMGHAQSMPIMRAILIKLAIVFTWIFSGIKLSDAHNGFRAFNRRALEIISCGQDGMSYASEVIDQIAEHKLRVAEVPVTVAYTDYSKAKGESNISKVMVGARFIWGKVIS